MVIAKELKKERNKMNKVFLSSVCFFALGVSSVQAQNMDYGSLQELFGEPVTTSANGSPMRASDAPMDMTIISEEEIARHPARSIPDILRHYAGVTVRQDTATSYSVGVRGYGQPQNERLLVLVNGRQVYQDYYGFVDWSLVPVRLGEIQQVEIVRGPNTALFGFNATSGVVNIVTKNPLYDDVDYVQGDLGFNGYVNGSGVVTMQNEDRFGIRLSASGSTIDEDQNTHDPGEKKIFTNQGRINSMLVDASLKLDDNTSVRFEGATSKSEQNGFAVTGSATSGTGEATSVKMSFSSDTDYGLIDASIYRNSTEPEVILGPVTLLFNNDVVVGQLSNTFKVGADHTFRVAGEFRDNIADFTLAGINFGTETLNIKSASGLWYWTPTDKLALSTAVRYDHVQADFDGSVALGGGPHPSNPFSNDEFSNRYDEFGYNFGLLYKLTDIDTVRFNAAKGIDLPSSAEMATQFAGVLYANPNIQASDVHDFQLGYERQLEYFQGSFKTTAFYQLINEMQYITTSTTANVGDSKVYGIELSLDGQTDNNIRWGISYSYSNVEDDFNGQHENLDYDDSNSDHMIKAQLGYSPNEKWDMDVFAAYESDYDAIRSVISGATTVDTNFAVDTEVIVDARVGYKPTDKWTLSLNGQALFGDNQQSAYGEDVDTQLFFRARYDF